MLKITGSLMGVHISKNSEGSRICRNKIKFNVRILRPGQSVKAKIMNDRKFIFKEIR